MYIGVYRIATGSAEIAQQVGLSEATVDRVLHNGWPGASIWSMLSCKHRNGFRARPRLRWRPSCRRWHPRWSAAASISAKPGRCRDGGNPGHDQSPRLARGGRWWGSPRARGSTRKISAVLHHDLRADANIAGRLIIQAHGGMSRVDMSMSTSSSRCNTTQRAKCQAPQGKTRRSPTKGGNSS